MQKEIKRHKCRDEAGNTYIVIESQTIIRTLMLDGTVEETGGTKSLVLTDGRAVTFHDENTFKIVATDELIRKIG